jgi:hypothetical protein
MAGDIKRSREVTLTGMASPVGFADPLAARAVAQLQDNISRLYTMLSAGEQAVAQGRSGDAATTASMTRTLRDYATRLNDHDLKLSRHGREIADLQALLVIFLSLPYWVMFQVFAPTSSARGTPFSVRCSTGGAGSLYFPTTGGGSRGFAAADGTVFMDGLWSAATADLTLLDTGAGAIWYDTKEYCIYLRVRVKPEDGLLQDATLQYAERLIGAEWPITWGYRYTGGYEEYDVPLAVVACLADRYTWNLTNLRPGAAIHLTPERNRVPCWAKITSGTGTSHVGDLYENGPDVAATRTGVTIKIPQIGTSAVIPAGTALLVVRQGLTTYWGQPPVWL